MNKVKKVISIALVLALIVGAGTGGAIWFQKNRGGKAIDVYHVDWYSTYFWEDMSYSSGTVESVRNQMIYPDSELKIAEYLVEEGQEVKAGDEILRYDTTKLQIDLEKAQLRVDQTNAEYNSEAAHLAHLNSLSPWVMPEIVIPEPEPLPESRTEVNDVIDEDAIPYEEDGDELHYLCSETCTVDPEFLAKIMDEENPKVIYLEIHAEYNDNGRILSGMVFDGKEKTIALLPEEPEELPEIEIPEIVIPEEAYSAEELKMMREESRKHLESLEFQKKTDALALETAQKALDGARVTAKEDGFISKVRDEYDAAAEGLPVVVISGGTGAYVRGTLAESLLEKVQIGDMVSAQNWETGMVYDCEIISISPYPTEDPYMMYGGTRQESYYDFKAFIPDADELEEYAWLDITIGNGTQESDTLCLMNAFIGDDGGRKFVWKVGENDTLIKVYVTTGRTVYGDYTEVFGDLTRDDLVAFPGSKGIREGSPISLKEF